MEQILLWIQQNPELAVIVLTSILGTIDAAFGFNKNKDYKGVSKRIVDSVRRKK